MISPFDILILIVFGVAWLRTLVLLVLAVAQRSGRRPPEEPQAWPALCVVIPAYNEARHLAATLDSVLRSRYPDFEVLVVDDGSTDGTASVVEGFVHAHPGCRVRLISHGNNRGKAAALNTGLAATVAPVIVTLDADTSPDPEALRRLVAALETGGASAAAANLKVADRGSLLLLFQSLEYITTLNLDRRAQARAGTITTVPGATSAWRRSALLEVGGFPGDTLTEDTDLSLSLLARRHTIVYADRAVSRTRAPETLRALFRQRCRWLYGNLQCAWIHRGGFARGTRALRAFGLPNFWFGNLFVYFLFPLALLYLPRFLSLVSPGTFLLLGAGFLALDVMLSALAYGMDAERWVELLLAPLQRVVLPFVLWAVFATVVVRLALRRPVRWRTRLSG